MRGCVIRSFPPPRRQVAKRYGRVLACMEVCHYATQPLVELYAGCMVVLKVPWCGIMASEVHGALEALTAQAPKEHWQALSAKIKVYTTSRDLQHRHAASIQFY